MASTQRAFQRSGIGRRLDRRSATNRRSRCKAKSMWGLAPVKGRFTEFSGDGQVTAPQTVSGHIDIKAASLRHRDRQARRRTCAPPISSRPRSFPDISVVVTGADAIDGDTVDLRAQLTIKGTTDTAARCRPR